ncbi:hypothetical protein HWV62_23807 [Athelia sp. TMB]|nr:hypothetical protein HWV62_23807 [Athelia sp. TMB]
MRLQLPGKGSAWVTSEGRELDLYGYPTAKPSDKTISAWAPSEEGKTFVIHWSISGDQLNQMLLAQGTVDGSLLNACVNMHTTEQHDPERQYKFRGFTRKSGTNAFVFKKIELTDDDSALDDYAGTSELGTFKLSIWKSKYKKSAQTGGCGESDPSSDTGWHPGETCVPDVIHESAAKGHWVRCGLPLFLLLALTDPEDHLRAKGLVPPELENGAIAAGTLEATTPFPSQPHEEGTNDGICPSSVPIPPEAINDGLDPSSASIVPGSVQNPPNVPTTPEKEQVTPGNHPLPSDEANKDESGSFEALLDLEQAMREVKAVKIEAEDTVRDARTRLEYLARLKALDEERADIKRKLESQPISVRSAKRVKREDMQPTIPILTPGEVVDCTHL